MLSDVLSIGDYLIKIQIKFEINVEDDELLFNYLIRIKQIHFIIISI